MSTFADSPLANMDLAPTGPAQRTPGEGGAYWYSNGYNWRALVAVAVGVIPVLPGFLHAATTEGGVIADPDFLDDLYRYGVFVAFALSAFAYFALTRAQSPAAATAD
jgi:NCS1 family nucleobase:cation symporter-1